MAASSFASVFGPKPLTVRTRPAMHAASSSARVPMPSESCRAWIFATVKRGASSITPLGIFSRSFASWPVVPVRTSSAMVAASAGPMPSTRVSCSSATRVARSSRRRSSAAAPRR